MKTKFISAFMDVAKRFAQLSSAKRLQVGAIIVKDDRIISIGYNGMPSGWDNNCETKEYMTDADEWLDFNEIKEYWPYEEKEEQIDSDDGIFYITRRYRLKTKPEVLHAETNAIAKLARSSESGDGADLFLTHAPCMDCAKLIYQSGIRRVYFGKQYRDLSGLEFLKRSGVTVEQVDEQD